MRKTMPTSHSGEQGQSMAEYGLILALIAAVCIMALSMLGVRIQGLLTQVVSSL
jgi:Flp pilus assembly pilin Flp